MRHKVRRREREILATTVARGIPRAGVPLVVLFALAMAITGGAAAAGPVALTEAELDRVTAGSASVAETQDLMRFDITRRTRSGRAIAVGGDLLLLDPTGTGARGNRLILNHAQNHLQSIININAVHSNVNVLLNLNISIDSRIDAVNQTNLNGIARSIRSGRIR